MGYQIWFERMKVTAKSEGVLGFVITPMSLYWYRSMSTIVGTGIIENVLEHWKNNVEHLRMRHNTIIGLDVIVVTEG